MIEVQASVAVERPPYVVFDFLADMTNNPHWQKGVRRCTWTTEPPLRMGSAYEQEARFLGQPTKVAFEVIEFEPDYRIRVKSNGHSLPVDVIREVSKEAGGGSKVRVIVQSEPQGWFLVFAFAVRWAMQARLRNDCRRLRQALTATEE